jgi:Mg2+-importing ATPase
VHKKLHDADTYQKIDEIPFDFQRRRMSVIVQKSDASQILICKGAVEEIIHCCSYAQAGSTLVPLDKGHHAHLEKVVAELNNEGFRVIAVAIKEEPIGQQSYGVKDETDLVLLGYIAFLDPPKDSAGAAIKKLNSLGVQVKILTGDNELITLKICHDVGLLVHQVMLGSQVDGMTDTDLMLVVDKVSVFAKMTPQQKARVITLLQKQGHVVGYMGDGINDGPGLKVADVSISVDTGVDIAKETADIILLEKSLMILQDGVIEGRRVFGNIMKYLKMSASSTFGNVLSMVGASAILPFLPMLPEHVLLNDLLYDFSQTSVPMDDVDQEYLAQPRAWDISGIGHYMLTIGPISSLFDYITFAFLWFVLHANSVGQSTLFQTGWFVESLLSQTLIVHVIRTGKIPFIESKPSPFLLMTTLGICIFGAFLPYTSLGQSIQMQGLPKLYWYGIVFIIPGYLLTTQLIKTFLIKRFGLI